MIKCNRCNKELSSIATICSRCLQTRVEGMKPFWYFGSQPSFIELMVSYSRYRRFNNIEKKLIFFYYTSDE